MRRSHKNGWYECGRRGRAIGTERGSSRECRCRRCEATGRYGLRDTRTGAHQRHGVRCRRTTVRLSWTDLVEEIEEDTGLVPGLFVYDASEDGWQELRKKLKEIAGADPTSTDKGLFATYEAAGKAFDARWKDRCYPISSAGEPPPARSEWFCEGPRRDEEAIAEEERRIALVRAAVGVMLERLQHHVGSDSGPLAQPGRRKANLLFGVPTWLFTAGDERIPLMIADALGDRGGEHYQRMGLDNTYSEWGACSGIGRGVYTVQGIKAAWQRLAAQPPSEGIYGAAAFGHPLARQPAATRVLCEEGELRRWVVDELLEGLTFMTRKWNFAWPKKKPGSVSLWARYLLLGVRGLMRMREESETAFKDIERDFDEITEKLWLVEQTSHQRQWLQSKWARQFELTLWRDTAKMCRGELAPVDMPQAP